jgi:Methyltransferase domain
MNSIQPDISKAQNIPGWMSVQELLWLGNKARNCDVIIEIGSYYGRSTRALCDNCPGVVYSIDPFKGPFFYNDGSIEYVVGDDTLAQFKENLKDHFDSGKIIQCRYTMNDFVGPLKANLIFIDGDHRYKFVRNDIERSLFHLANNGIISGHDYNVSMWPGVTEAVNEAFDCNVNTHDTIWWRRLNENSNRDSNT